jgi:putative endonuclease
VYFESCSDVRAAIEREKKIKGLLRSKKVELIKTMNPRWDDFSATWSESQ